MNNSGLLSFYTFMAHLTSGFSYVICYEYFIKEIGEE